MIEKIKGLKNCMCVDQDSLANKVYLTNKDGKSVQVLICPACGGQIETEKEE